MKIVTVNIKKAKTSKLFLAHYSKEKKRRNSRLLKTRSKTLTISQTQEVIKVRVGRSVQCLGSAARLMTVITRTALANSFPQPPSPPIVTPLLPLLYLSFFPPFSPYRPSPSSFLSPPSSLPLVTPHLPPLLPLSPLSLFPPPFFPYHPSFSSSLSSPSPLQPTLLKEKQTNIKNIHIKKQQLGFE